MPPATWTDDSKSTSFCFTNRTTRPVGMYWIDYTGNPVGQLYQPDQTGCWMTADTHGFVVYAGARCLGSFRATNPAYVSLFEVDPAGLADADRHSCLAPPPPPDPGQGSGSGGEDPPPPPPPPPADCDWVCRCVHPDGEYGPGCFS